MIRFGVIGTNWITDRFLTSAKEIADFQFAAVYSRTEEKAKEFAGKYDVNSTYTDLEEFAHSDGFDAVYIASPTAFHAEHAIACMKGGKHVIVEKPFASNAGEVEKMIETAKSNNVTLMEAMKTTHVPNFNKVKENLEKIGPVRRYIANFCQYSSRYDKYKEGIVLNAFKPELSNGSLMDIGVYCLYPMVALFGAPEKVQASAYMLDSGVDGQGSVIAQYSEFNGIAMFSKITNSVLPSEIQGEKGSIVIGKFSDMVDVKIVYHDGNEENISVEQKENTMYYEALSFIETIKNGKLENKVNTWERSIETMKVLDKARAEIGLVFPADK
ncbi:Predicted dehydrogenase [Gracilibacillus ureilyticus]|uniref:Predicted dehydrogenase n=1 Tax=Gracilibacillus ureilyticus TaxID=531814 RepID=A0A1H9QTZ5_9BACI|nr:Gfo/Idh/MocA family oxidoreductase [Gracilibacillus ureilyticus]SER64081.1 Predicted dehydrogenase [Gracilibacillus ureilyticus]